MLSLEILDKKCEHRATVDLMDEKGRKATGGKLTVEARLREPLTGSNKCTVYKVDTNHLYVDVEVDRERSYGTKECLDLPCS